MIKIGKLAVGSAAAIMIAYSLGLDYAVSAGIIALLSLQDTKKATLSIAFMRIAAFALATFIAFMVFSLFAYSPIMYGLFLLIFTGICYWLKLYDAIPINAVLVTHYLLEEEMSITMITNEALLLLIGAGIGIILNLYIPNNVKQIRRRQRIIEEDLKEILTDMAEQLMRQEKADYDGQRLDQLKEHIIIGIKQAYTNMNNTFFQETRYYIEYMEMRHQQYNVLKDIDEKIRTLTSDTHQTYEIAEFISAISSSLSESQNTKGLLLMEEELLTRFQDSPLPVTREEFENRAVLYVILMDFQMFLMIKKEFVDSLTEEQKRRYWKCET